MRNLSLRKRILFCFSMLILMFLIISYYVINYVRKDQLIDRISKAKMIAKVLSFPICEAISTGRLDSLRSNMLLLKSSPSYKEEIILLNVYNNRKKLIASTSGAEFNDEKLNQLIRQKGKIKILSEREVIHTFVPIKIKEYVCGYILVSFSKIKVNKDLCDLYKIIFLVFTFFLLVLIIVYFQVTKFLIKPLNVLNEGINKINSGNYAISIPVVTNDEIGKVISTFNVMAETIRGKIEAIEKMNLKLREMYDKAIRDGLTGLYNQSYFNMKLQEYLISKKNFGIILMDIDYFKKINDTYGHLAGDFVLKKFAEVISTEFSTDFIARYGGEEFVIILEEQNLKNRGERIRKKIESSILNYNGINISITISCGCAQFSEDGKSASELLENADKSLYYAKRTGRNKTICFKEIKSGI